MDLTAYPLLNNWIEHTFAQASVWILAPLNFRRPVTRPVSYYALF